MPGAGPPVAPERVEDLLQALEKAVRAHQLYDEKNPVYRRFISAFRNAFAPLWEVLDRLQLNVGEESLRWEGTPVYRNQTRADSLAFLFYKDGVRSLTFLPGFEDEELVEFLEVLHRARHQGSDEDDLLTLLWEADFSHVRYSYVDLLAEGISVPEPSSEPPAGLPELQQEELQELREEVAAEEAPPDEAPQEGEPADEEEIVSSIQKEDFDATLYFLDEGQLRYLQEEVRREMERDLRGDVLNALFDRLEEPDPGRQGQILKILETLLPSFLSRGALEPAARVLDELRSMLRDGEVFDEERAASARELLREASDPEAIEEIVRSLEAGALTPDPEVLGTFFRHLGEPALPPLVRATEAMRIKEIRAILEEAVERIAREHRDALARLFRSEDPVVAAGAVRLAGRIGAEETAGDVVAMLAHPEASVRLAAVEAAVALRASAAVDALQDVLEDEAREVRIAAARGLGSLRYRPAVETLREILQGKGLRHADLTEKIAFFEAYGNLGDPEGPALLDELLNGRTFLGRKEPSEIRACAALALGRIGDGDAREALQEAVDDDDPIVKSAVGRALRGEE